MLVVLSGGMDSTVCAALAVRDFGAGTHGGPAHRLRAANRTRESGEAFQEICDRMGIRTRLAVQTPFFRAIGGSALTDEQIAVPQAGPEIGSGDPGDLCSLP